jgi:hypothetical protein
VTDNEVNQGFHGLGWGWVGQWNRSHVWGARYGCVGAFVG